MRGVILIALLIGLAAPAEAQRIQGTNGPGEAIPVRCVNVLGTAFEACGGTAGAGTSVSGTHAEAEANDPTNLFTLPAQALETGPSYADNQKVSLSVDLGGYLRTKSIMQDGSGNGLSSGTADPASNARGLFVRLVQGQAVAVSGTFFQVTQPVSIAAMPSTPVTGTFWPTTAVAPSSTRLSDGAAFYDARSIRALTFAGDKVDISGSTLGANSGVDIGDVTINNAGGAAAVNIQDGGNVITVDGTVGVTGVSTLVEQQTQTTALQLIDNIVSGTGANVSQFGGTNVVTGTGAGGAGIPRVTISNDSSLAANQSVNVAQINGVTPLMGTGATGTGSQRVTLATNSPGFSTANGTIAADSGLGATRAVAYGSSPTAVTAGNQGPQIGDLEGIQYVNTGHPRAVFCQMAAAITTTLVELTGCAAVASNSYYISSVVMTGGAIIGATVPALLRSGTGTNCATATTTWATCWHPAADSCVFDFQPPMKITAGHAICAIDATTGTKAVMVTGYIAP